MKLLNLNKTSHEWYSYNSKLVHCFYILLFFQIVTLLNNYPTEAIESIHKSLEVRIFFIYAFLTVMFTKYVVTYTFNPTMLKGVHVCKQLCIIPTFFVEKIILARN